MQRSRIEIYLHFVWTTHRREHLLTPDVEKRIHRCIVHEIEKKKSLVLAIGGMPDHVHVVASLHSTVSAAILAQKMKGISSVLANRELGFEGAFDWQDNYAAFSVGGELNAVVEYVRRQKEHHAAGNLWPQWEEAHEEA